MAWFRNQSGIPFRLVARTSHDPAAHRVFVAMPGEVIEGPLGYAKAFARGGLVEVPAPEQDAAPAAAGEGGGAPNSAAADADVKLEPADAGSSNSEAGAEENQPPPLEENPVVVTSPKRRRAGKQGDGT